VVRRVFLRAAPQQTRISEAERSDDEIFLLAQEAIERLGVRGYGSGNGVRRVFLRAAPQTRISEAEHSDPEVILLAQKGFEAFGD